MRRRLYLAVMAAVPLAGAAQAAPSINALRFKTPTLNSRFGAGIPLVDIGFTAPAGLRQIQLTLSAPGGVQSVMLSLTDGFAPLRGTVTVGNTPLSQYAQPGAWTVTALSASDVAGNTTTLSAAQIAALEGSATMHVSNPGQVDITPPTLSHGRIFTRKISLSAPSPVITLGVDAVDAGSGIAYVSAILYSSAGGAIGLGDFGQSFTHAAAIKLSSDGNTLTAGTYTIGVVNACDIANNCKALQDQADILQLFGGSDTIIVTQ